ncbi:hemicentin-2-like [Planococcus citri]|uniref:hemicentin-2-like n=1 Tax=Planococcus citri TaxID=170843 RepID=UPI0031F81843
MLDFQTDKVLNSKMRRKTKVCVFILVLMTVITEIKPDNDFPSTTMPPPQILTGNGTTYHNIRSNGSLSLNCTVNQTSSGYVVNYTWYKNDQPLQNGSAIFLVNGTSQSNAGRFEYSCQACNSDGCAKHIFQVTILTPEQIEKCVGESVELVCELYDVSHTIEWYGPYRARPNSSYNPDDDVNDMDSKEEQIYRKENLNVTDSGWYLCNPKGNKWMPFYLNVTNGSKCQNLNSTTSSTSPSPPEGSNSIVYIIGLIICVIIGVGYLKYSPKKDVRIEAETELKTLCAPEETRINNVGIYSGNRAQSISRWDHGEFH